MNFLNVENIFALLITAIGSYYDARFRRVPNWLTFGSSGIALIYYLCTFKGNLILYSVLGFGLGLILLLIPYIMGGMGAGDVKLLAALGAIVGYKNILYIFFYSTIAGMFLGIFWILRKPEHLKFILTTGQILPVINKKEKVPYAIAIFLGTIFHVIASNTNGHFLLWQ